MLQKQCGDYTKTKWEDEPDAVLELEHAKNLILNIDEENENQITEVINYLSN